ncbi:MAG: putative hydrolase of the superfamily [Actinomycetota bacterium]|nr:putative hydrolase of the superfamily [Actinomycetota bacterium]
MEVDVSDGHGDGVVRAVVFDFGGPVLLTPFELLRDTEARLGLEPGALDWRGPFDPGADPLWREMIAGDITERDYWQRRAEQLHALAATGEDVRHLFAAVFDGDQALLVRPESHQVMRQAAEKGLTTGVLTNDLARFHPAAWIEGNDFLRDVDVIVDGSVTGALKPDPRAFQLLLEALDLPAGDVLFTDDQRHNVEAAARAGLRVVWFDVTAPARSAAEVAAAAGLGRPVASPPG